MSSWSKVSRPWSRHGTVAAPSARPCRSAVRLPGSGSEGSKVPCHSVGCAAVQSAQPAGTGLVHQNPISGYSMNLPFPSESNDARRRVAELFAGVGGFHLGLRPSGWEVVWANQWEPSTKSQPAADCYRARFPAVEFVGEDIATVLDRAQADPDVIPDHELLVGGFPCQDYS